jgi:16S rRNA (guanine527-N7)-methyltransferase
MVEDALSRLKAAADALGVQLDHTQVAAFDRYRELLLDWNTRVNLTAITDPDEVETLHFVDSLAALPGLAPYRGRTIRLVDIGSGAGLPGLALKIACPEIDLTLVESVGKKATFIQYAIATLDLKRTRVIVARAEEIGQNRAHRERYDVAVARALASLPVLSEYCLPLLAVGGRCLAYKKTEISQEIAASRNAIDILGGRMLPPINPSLPGLPADRQVLVIEKVRATPPAYPRRPGTPAKTPL